LGNANGAGGGLQSVLADLDNLGVTLRLNRPFRTITPQREFSFRQNLFGLNADSFEATDAFRAILESSIVQRVQDLPFMQDFAQLSEADHFGAAIVIRFRTENAGSNFFGNAVDPPYGGERFPTSRNAKILRYALRFEGVNASQGGIGTSLVKCFLMPVGDSVLRQNSNRPVVEDEPLRSWLVMDQYLPLPPENEFPGLPTRDYNPWQATAGSGGNYLGAVKRFLETLGQVEIGQPLAMQEDLVGRAAWNSDWVLVIPGAQFTSGTGDADTRDPLDTFINGRNDDGNGITDIRWFIDAYSN
jgi:hypothetical protein